jgi:hypothetical protein
VWIALFLTSSCRRQSLGARADRRKALRVSETEKLAFNPFPLLQQPKNPLSRLSENLP